MTDETTPDAVEQAIAHLVNVFVSECSHTSETASALDVCIGNLRHAHHAERARHAEEVARLRAELADRRTRDEDVRTCLEYCDEDDPTPGGIGGLARELLKRFSGSVGDPPPIILECSHEGDDPSLCEACGSPVIQLGVLGSRLYLRCTCCGMQTSIQNSRSEVARIPESEWTWYGHPLHFVGARTCFFRMGTKVGEYVVSTVGDWSVDGSSESRELDRGRKFETMVFRARGSHAECGCPDIEPEELECVGYNDAASAQAGHVEMCRKVAAGAFND